MTTANVEVVRASYEAYARGDFEAVAKTYAADAEWDDRPFRPDGRVHRGLEEMAGLVLEWRAEFDEHSWENERVVDAGAKTVIICVERGRGKRSGAPVENRRGHVVTVEDGKIVHTVVYPTAAEALAAVGLTEG